MRLHCGVQCEGQKAHTGDKLGRMASAWSGIPSQRTQATATCRVHIASRSSGSFACFIVADTYIHNPSKVATAMQTVRMHKVVLCSLRVQRKTLVTQSPMPGYAMPTIPCGLDDGETFGGDNGKATTRRARVMLKSCPVPGKRRGFAFCVSFRILREQSSRRGMSQQPRVPNLARIRLLDFGRQRRKLRGNACPQSCCLH